MINKKYSEPKLNCSVYKTILNLERFLMDKIGLLLLFFFSIFVCLWCVYMLCAYWVWLSVYFNNSVISFFFVRFEVRNRQLSSIHFDSTFICREVMKRRKLLFNRWTEKEFRAQTANKIKNIYEQRKKSYTTTWNDWKIEWTKQNEKKNRI